MTKRQVVILSVFLVICFSITVKCFAQGNEHREAKQEKILDEMEIKKLQNPFPHKFVFQAGISAGYDNNVRLSPQRKGDAFEETTFSLGYRKPLPQNYSFTFNYDLDATNYDEVTDASNILNHVRFGIHKKIATFTAGTGYDLGVFYYPRNEDGNFLLHRAFVYLRQNIGKKIYHQLLYEPGLKMHTDRKAIGDTITALQDKERVDRRQSIEYSIGEALTSKLILKFRARFLINDSNARFQDFYDYKAYEASPGIDYKFSKKLDIVSNFVYLRRNYKTRQVTLQTDKQRDNVYVANLGVKYKLDKNNVLSLLYTYRDNHTNESLEKYNENVMSCGWQYNF
jgi:hypothetical protein